MRMVPKCQKETTYGGVYRCFLLESALQINCKCDSSIALEKKCIQMILIIIRYWILNQYFALICGTNYLTAVFCQLMGVSDLFSLETPTCVARIAPLV